MNRPRVVIVGAGFAGYHAARTLSRLARGAVEIVVVNPTDYFLYVPLLPEVAVGLLEPRRVAVSIPDTLPGVRLVIGELTAVDLEKRCIHYVDPESQVGQLDYDRLVLAAGSVNKSLPIPGATEHAHGFRTLPEALYLRDHITEQIELADATDDPAEREARCTFVVVGGGYTGTEVAAYGALYTSALADRHPRLGAQRPRWMVLDIADRILPELDTRMSEVADQVLRSRGVDIRTETSVREVRPDAVVLSDGQTVPTRSVIWCVGSRPDPLVANVGLETVNGRVLVDEYLTVPGHPEVYACGDAAAVPDPAQPGQFTPMTAQHAVRHGKLVARNIAATFGIGNRRPYRFRTIGFAVDLGRGGAVANPFEVLLTGAVARLATRGYHLLSMPANRTRVLFDWLLNAISPWQGVRLGTVPKDALPLDSDAPELVQVR